jgi:selenocysteine-specific elongation factor
LLIARNDWEELQQQATDALAAHHAQFPLRRGLPKEDLRSRLNLPPAVFPLVLAHLLPSGAIAEDASTVRIPTHVPHLPPDKQRAADAYVAALEAGGFTPPADAKLDTETLAFLADQGRVVHLAADVVYGAQAYARAKDLVVARLRQNGKITVGDARDLLGASRRYALALLEHLDTQHITRRQGDERVLVGR